MSKQNSVAAQNILALKKKEFDVKFDLTKSPYEPVEKIGTGAYGVVCSAVHKKNKDKVAIKKIQDIFCQPTIAKRTLREVKILKHFKHDNIISIREILKPSENLDEFRDIYIVLDFMETDMHRVIHSTQELSDEHIRYFLYQILRGLKYIHSANVIHRDLKPSNLLVNENCDVKIGDFGMARGVSSNPDEHNHLLTQYVATRWYRAPEIMMAQVAYSGAVDMWSVGCILAEMLGRRQLFPGHDYIDQIKLVIGIVGSPSKDFLNVVQSQNMKNFLCTLGHKEPESFRKLYPKAKNKALQVLEKALLLDPTKRLNVEDALKHPYFSNYHDPDDEPICIPAFDFSFETKELLPKELKDEVVKEIMDYHLPKPKPQLTFNFRPVPQDELLKTPSPKVMKPSTSNPLPFSKPITKDMMDKIAEQFKAAKKDGGDAFSSSYSHSKMSKLKQMPKKTCIKTELLAPTDNDIEMLSAKLSAAKVDEGSVGVNKDVLSFDVVMRSAKTENELSQQVVPSVTVEDNKEEQKPINAKEALKAALLNAKLKKEAGGEKKRPMTALQRQRDNEEKKKKKLEKAREKKKKQKEKDSPMKLTTDDLQLLERWKTMQGSKTETATKSTVPQNSLQHNAMIRAPAFSVPQTNAANHVQQGNAGNSVPQCIIGNSVPQNNIGNSIPQNNIGNSVPQNNIGNSVPQNNIGNSALQNNAAGNIPQCSVTNSISLAPNTSTGQPPLSRNVVPPQQNTIDYPQSVPDFTMPDYDDSNSLPPYNVLLDDHNSQTSSSLFADSLLDTASERSQDSLRDAAVTKSPPSYTEAMLAKTSPANPNTFPDTEHLDEPFSRYADSSKPLSPSELLYGIGFTGVTSPQTFLPADPPIQSVNPLSMQHPSLVGNMSQLPGTTSTSVLLSQPAALFQPQPATLQPSMNNQNAAAAASTISHPPAPACIAPKHSLPPHTTSSSSAAALSDFLSAAATSSSSHVYNQAGASGGTADLPLIQTPKGTGAGYGVGLDLNAILAESQPSGEIRLDSAPLSASLIQDWMDMTGNLDTKDLENLELEIGLPVNY